MLFSPPCNSTCDGAERVPLLCSCIRAGFAFQRVCGSTATVSLGTEMICEGGEEEQRVASICHLPFPKWTAGALKPLRHQLVQGFPLSPDGEGTGRGCSQGFCSLQVCLLPGIAPARCHPSLQAEVEDKSGTMGTAWVRLPAVSFGFSLGVQQA